MKGEFLSVLIATVPFGISGWAQQTRIYVSLIPAVQ
jgi:hypothetical protein